MAQIRLFKGLRFSAEAGPLESVTAPPYDVLSPAERDEYAARSPHNIVHLTLPEQHKEDRSQFVKYARSASLLADWRRSGAVQLENAPALYRYKQQFAVPGSNEKFTRTSIIVLIKTEPYEKGVVLPHEQTFPKHKEDRLRILEATRSHLECIFGLFEDPDAEIHKAILDAPCTEFSRCSADDGSEQSLEPIVDKGATDKLIALLADRKVWIADGHHRYETACTFRASVGPKDGPVAEDYMMIALASMSDPGLVLLPTHRVIKTYTGPEILAALKSDFEIEEVAASVVWDTLSAEEGSGVFGLVLGSSGFLLRTKNFEDLVSRIPSGSEKLRRLDVSVLHSVVLEQTLGIQGLDTIGYTRDPDEAVDVVLNQGSVASFLMKPPSVEDMRVIALGGEKMPQKSTYYFPKILSGTVMWSLSDF